MNTQINLRLPEQLLTKAQLEARKKGFATLQEFIKEILRESLFEDQGVTKKELNLIKALYKVSEDKGLYGTEKQLFDKLNKK
ncbi:hypothetical protein HOD29_00055 [archaeon]|jgi:hypothetical protein|nr:hypothetical protein [archaeon]